MRHFVVATGLVAVLFSASASAVGSGPRTWHERDGDSQCMYGHGYADLGHTEFVILQNGNLPSNQLAIGVKNDNWSVKAGDLMTEPVIIRSGTFAMRGNAIALDRKLLVTIPRETVMKFASTHPRLVEVWVGNRMLTRLGFSGFEAGWDGFNHCLARLDAARAEEDRRQRQANPDVPVDPFAPPAQK